MSASEEEVGLGLEFGTESDSVSEAEEEESSAGSKTAGPGGCGMARNFSSHRQGEWTFRSQSALPSSPGDQGRPSQRHQAQAPIRRERADCGQQEEEGHVGALDYHARCPVWCAVRGSATLVFCHA